MHAGADDCPAQTVGSMVSELHEGRVVHWVTGTAAPCISIFKPIVMDVSLPVHGPRPPIDLILTRFGGGMNGCIEPHCSAISVNSCRIFAQSGTHWRPNFEAH